MKSATSPNTIRRTFDRHASKSSALSQPIATGGDAVAGEYDKTLIVPKRSLPDGLACSGLRGPNTRVIPADEAAKTTALTARRASRRPLRHTILFNILNINLMNLCGLRQSGRATVVVSVKCPRTSGRDAAQN
jgi:hypothetical protein